MSHHAIASSLLSHASNLTSCDLFISMIRCLTVKFDIMRSFDSFHLDDPMLEIPRTKALLNIQSAL